VAGGKLDGKLWVPTENAVPLQQNGLWFWQNTTAPRTLYDLTWDWQVGRWGGGEHSGTE
jgi:hypothetical protein